MKTKNKKRLRVSVQEDLYFFNYLLLPIYRQINLSFVQQITHLTRVKNKIILFFSLSLSCSAYHFFSSYHFVCVYVYVIFTYSHFRSFYIDYFNIVTQSERKKGGKERESKKKTSRCHALSA